MANWLAVTWALKNLLRIISGLGFFATELLGVVLVLVCGCVLAWKGGRNP
jgi:hypothetical protein